MKIHSSTKGYGLRRRYVVRLSLLSISSELPSLVSNRGTKSRCSTGGIFKTNQWNDESTSIAS